MTANDWAKKQKNSGRSDEPEEMELMLKAPCRRPLNTMPGLFERDQKRRFGGINTQPSVFNGQAVFRTDQEGALES